MNNKTKNIFFTTGYVFRKAVIRGLSDVRVMLATIYERLDDIENNQNVCNDLLQQIPTNGKSIINSNNMAAIEALFPLQNTEQLEVFEASLISEDYKQEVVSTLFEFFMQKLKTNVQYLECTFLTHVKDRLVVYFLLRT